MFCWEMSFVGNKLPSGGRRAVGVVQHGVEGPGEVVGQGAARLAVRQRNQAGQQQEEQQQQLQGEGGSKEAGEERSRWGRFSSVEQKQKLIKAELTPI